MTKNDFDPKAVLQFWFEELDDEDHFVTNKEVDNEIIKRFSDMHAAAVSGQLEHWGNTPEGALALIIVLDQFSRNMFRGDAKSFAHDSKALKVAKHSVEKGFDMQLPKNKRLFVYMPYMHSEDASVHTEAVQIFENFGDVEVLKYEHIHKDIIDRFGRYPHRNATVGRASTEEELQYLSETTESFF